MARFALVASAPLRPPADRLHRTHSGPVYAVRSSVWPRSQVSPWWMGWWQRGHGRTPSAARIRSHRLRSRLCASPYPRLAELASCLAMGSPRA